MKIKAKAGVVIKQKKQRHKEILISKLFDVEYEIDELLMFVLRRLNVE
jgi:hypothetical protein